MSCWLLGGSFIGSGNVSKIWLSDKELAFFGYSFGVKNKIFTLCKFQIHKHKPQIQCDLFFAKKKINRKNQAYKISISQIQIKLTQMEKQYKVACFGAGFVGLPTSSVLALHNPDVEFVVFDIDQKKISKCKEGHMPIFEPNLEQTMSKVHNKNLTFSTDISVALTKASVVFLALPTPTKTWGENSGKAYDLSYTERGVSDIIEFYNQNPDKIADKVVIVEKSTVPIGTAQMITRIIHAVSIPENKDKYVVASNPEFLAQGSAIKDLMVPDRVVLGVRQQDDVSRLVQLYDYTKDRVIKTNQSSSQLSKLVANCFLAQRVSSINSIAILCEEYQADVKQVKKCIAADTRIGDKFLNSSIGFGGSCFQKDILALIYLAECKGLTEVADYWTAVIEMNDHRKKKFFQRVFNQLNSNLKGKKLAIFGTAFKKDTCDARESPAIGICKDFLIEGAILQIYDPKTTREMFIQEMIYKEIWEDKYADRIIQVNSAKDAVRDSHAIVINTEWDEFITLDYASFYPLMKKPAYIFDGRNILNEAEISSLGFSYCRIGKNFIRAD